MTIRWNTRTIPYYINPQGSGLDLTELQPAIQSAFDAWSPYTGITFHYMGATTTKNDQFDNHNTVFWDTTGAVVSSQRSLARTIPTWDDSTGIITDMDIAFAAGIVSTSAFTPPIGSDCQGIAYRFGGVPLVWTIGQQGIGGIPFLNSVYNADVQATATHEIGHLLGLGHSTVQNAVMSTMSNPVITPEFFCNTKQRNLQTDDIVAIQTLYTGSAITQATLDGNTWSGQVGFTIASSAGTTTRPSVPNTLPNLFPDLYTLTYTGGGPPNSTLVGISPCGLLARGPTPCVAQLNAGQTLTFTLHFKTNPPTAGFTMSSGSSSATEGQAINLSTSTSGATVKFDATQRSATFDGATLTGYLWAIDGAPVSTSSTFTYSFITSGQHNVTLVVIDSFGKSSAVASGMVIITQVTSLILGRHSHRAVLLNNGSVLITGGSVSAGGESPAPEGGMIATNVAEIFNPSTGLWRNTRLPEVGGGPLLMGQARSGHSATLLTDGRVLIAGGSATDLASAEIFDPATETFAPVAEMNHYHQAHAAVRLTDGRVMVIGGYDQSPVFGYSSVVELYDPRTGKWALASPLPGPVTEAAASALPNNRVLVTGLNGVNLYDDSLGSWRVMTNLHFPRWTHTSTALPDGKVLLLGGNDGSTPNNMAELYDVNAGSLGQSTVVGPTAVGGWRSMASQLSNGDVIVSGGYNYPLVNNGCCALAVPAVQLYSYALGTITSLSPMAQPRGAHTSTTLASDQVLVSGGFAYDYATPMDNKSGIAVLNSAELLKSK